MSEIDKVVRALVANLDAPPYQDTRTELSPVLCVLTVLLSLDRRKPGYIEERIKRLQTPDPGYNTLAGVRDYAALLTPEKYFLVDARDDGKRAGLLLTLLDALIDGGRDFPGKTEADRMKAWAEAARPSDYAFGPFRGLGLKGFQYLRQLLGANTVIPTKEIVAFLARAIERDVDAPEAVYLLERAAARLRYDLRGVPNVVWSATALDGGKKAKRPK
jgi:hypothetical protein